MVRRKSKATIMVADGGGGLAKVQDRRFEIGDWPIRFIVPTEQADTWFRYFNAECGRRGWSSSGIGQLEARENSGSITVSSGGPGSPQLAVVWDWKRDGPINIRARSAGTPEFAITHAQELFDQTNRCRTRATERFFRWGQLEYEGLAWRGELWLEDTLRLGPPSQQYESALLGPRVIIVECLGGLCGLERHPVRFQPSPPGTVSIPHRGNGHPCSGSKAREELDMDGWRGRLHGANPWLLRN